MDEQQALACRIATAIEKINGIDWRVGKIKKPISTIKEVKGKIKIGDIVIYATLKNDKENVWIHKVPKINMTGATKKDLVELSKLLINEGIKIPKKCIS